MRGGALIATGEHGNSRHRNKPLADFALADVLGVRRAGRRRRARDRTCAATMDMQVNGAVRSAFETTTARVAGRTLPRPRSGRRPRKRPTGPGMTMNQFGKGQAIYCAVRIIRRISSGWHPALRKLASWMLREVFTRRKSAQIAARKRAVQMSKWC